jgi:hypothetical protein
MTARTAPSVLRQYVLGRVSESDRDAVELELLSDRRTQEELASVHDELIEEYLEGTLSAGERTQFEQHFLSSPEHRREVEAAQILKAGLLARTPQTTAPAAPRPAMGLPLWLRLAAGLGIVAVGAFWFAQRAKAPAGSVASAPPATSTSVPGMPPSPPSSEPPLPASAQTQEPPRVASLVLAPGRLMGGAATATTKLAGATKALRLELLVEDPRLRRYRVLVTTSDAREVWKQDDVKAQTSEGGATVAVEIPADRLSAGAYEVALVALPKGASAGRYYFQLARD